MPMSIEPEPYRLRISGFDRSQERWIGTLLTLANGRLGVRGELELAGSRSNACFLSGLYNNIPLWRRELVMLPTVSNVYLPYHFDIIDHGSVERLLDMRRGLLVTRAGIGRSIEYYSENAVHRRRKNLFMQRIRLTSDSEDVVILPIENPLNPFLYGYTYTEHLSRERLVFSDNILRVFYRLRDADTMLEVRMMVDPGASSQLDRLVTRDSAGFIIRGRGLDVKRYVEFYIHREGAKGDLEEIVREEIPDWASLLSEHMDSWSRLWDEIGLEIDGSDRLAGSITFYTYHLLQLIDDDGEELMIPARGLHGIGYRGHIFWDTDLYLLPFLTFLYPRAMRGVLSFRCRTLEKAIQYARETGYRGARYPWESVDDGYESTPRYYPVDLDRCKCIDILTGEQEIHVTGDIAFSVLFYYNVTGDEEFMKRCGFRILIETARYWASRVEYDAGKDAYVIRNVIGPDEYHVGVDNNFFTNLIAKYNLKAAFNLVINALKNDEKLLEHLGVSLEEVMEWGRIAEKISLGRERDGVIEEFEGFFDIQADGKVVERGAKRVGVSKQADVVLALLLKEIVEGVEPEILRKNYEYYLERTTHESSLSLPIFATVAIMLGIDERLELFSRVLETDLGNMYGNTHDGFHVAAAGGIWYAILFGLLGIRLRNGELVYHPRRSGDLRLAVNINYRGNRIRISTL